MSVIETSQLPLALPPLDVAGDVGGVVGGVGGLLGQDTGAGQPKEPIDRERPEPERREPVDTSRPRARRLNYDQQLQQQDKWCWAAVSVSICRFYDPSNRVTQCELANSQKGQTTCCQDGTTEQCNQPHNTASVVQFLGNLAEDRSDSLSFEAVQDQILAGAPVGVIIFWKNPDGTLNGNSHVVVAEGYSARTRCIAIEDPWFGTSVWSYEKYKSNKDSDWKETLLTKRA